MTSVLFISQMEYLKARKVNKNGVSRMTRNILAVQQALTNILGVKESFLDRARQYWSLAVDDKAKEFWDSNPSMFTKEEIASLGLVNKKALS